MTEKENFGAAVGPTETFRIQRDGCLRHVRNVSSQWAPVSLQVRLSRELQVDADIRNDKTFFFATMLILTYLVVITANLPELHKQKIPGEVCHFSG